MNSDLIFHITVVVLLITGIATNLRYNPKIQPLLSFLFLLTTIRLLQKEIVPQENSLFLTGILGGVVGLNLVVATLMKSNKFRWIAPIASIVLIFLIGKNELMFGDYSLDFSDVKVTGIIALGFLAGVISCTLSFVLKRFFTENDKKYIESTATVVLIGLFIIPATFFVAWYGILLLAIGYFLYTIYNETKRDTVFISLLAITAISGIASVYGIESIDLSVGKMIAGLIVGAGAYSLGLLALKSTNKLVGMGFVFLGILVVTLIALLNNIHPAYGGAESLLTAFFGMALVGLFAGKNEVSNVFFPAFLVIGLFFLSDPFATEDVIQSNETAPTNQTTLAEPQEPAGMDMSELSGKYTIISETATISFQLGPKGGITKGAIKNFEGTVDFGNNTKTAKFNVKLPTKNLTTFNSIRDESVLGAAYLNEGKFPLMSFSSTTIEAKEDGYLLKGNFTLLGKTNTEEVFVKYLGEKDGKHQFFGTGAINRTKYGMASSPQEGNVVDFTFTMELK